MPQRLEQPEPLSLLEIHFLLCLTDTPPVAGVSCAEHIPALQTCYVLGNGQQRNECVECLFIRLHSQYCFYKIE